MYDQAYKIGVLDALTKFGSHSFGMSIPVPGTPFSVGASGGDANKERLPGMTRWVPRETIERAFANTEAGFDPQAVVDAEGEHGNLMSPLFGAGAGAAAAHFFAPGSGLAGKALGAIGGAGLSAAHHKLTEGKRREHAAQALRGIARDRGFALQGQPTATANESQPLAVSGGSGT